MASGKTDVNSNSATDCNVESSKKDHEDSDLDDMEVVLDDEK